MNWCRPIGTCDDILEERKHGAYARLTMLIDHVSTASVNLVPVEVPLHAARTRAEEVQRNASAMSS